MQLKFKTKEEAPEELHEHLKEVTEGEEKFFSVTMVAKQRLDQFRDNNTNLSKKVEGLDAFQAKIKPLIPEGKTEDDLLAEIKELRDVAQKVKDGKIKGSDQIEVEVNSRTEAMKRAHDETVQNLTRDALKWKTAAETVDHKYRQSVIEAAVSIAAGDPKVGVNPKAMPHILSAARGVYVVDDNGKMLPKDSGGNTIWSEDGTTPMTISEWLKKLRSTDEYFFLGSSGGGAGGGNGDGKGMGGLSQAEIAKLPAMERLKLANRHGNGQ